MAAYDVFNPDVPDIQPGNYDVTRPISRPEANTARGKLLATLGEGLKDTGQIVTDATKLKDFTNKEQIANTALIKTEGERQAHKANLENLNRITGTDPSLLAGGEGPPLPAGLKGLAKKASTLAVAKADENQLDVYYRGRIDQLAKQFRTAYPQYRDFIDHTFEKLGFGNPANQYVAALERQFLKNQAALNAKDTETESLIREGLHRGYEGFDDLGIRHRNGEDVYVVAAREFAANAIPKNRIDMSKSALELGKVTGEARKDSVGKYTTDYQQQVLSTALNSKASPQSLGSVMDRMEGYMRNPETADKDQVQQDAALVTNHINRLRDQYRQEGNTPRDFTDPITGKKTQLTDRQAMGGSAFDAGVEDTLTHLTKIRDAVVNHDYGAATFDSRIVAGWESSFKKHIYSQPTLGGVMQMMNEIKSYPEASREFLKGVFADPNLVNIPQELKGATESWAARFLTKNPGSAKEAVETLSKENNSSAANNFILNQTEQILNKKIDPSLRNNAVQAFFGPKNDGILDNMSANQASAFFAKVTDPKYVSAINELGKKASETHQTWVEGEVNRLFSRDFKLLPEMAEHFKLHYDDLTHQFGLDYGKYTNINRWPKSAIDKLFSPQSGTDILSSGNSARVVSYGQVIDRVNAAAGGLGNVAIGQGKEPNAYIFRNMQATGNTENDFWRAVRGQAQKYKEPIGPEKPGVGAGP